MHVDAILHDKGAAVFTVSAGATIADAVTALNRHNIGAVLVVDEDGGLAGIVSERDIVRLLGRDAEKPLQRPVSECMTTNLITCRRGTSVAEVMDLMTRYRIRHMPVVEAGRLYGIVSIGDVVKRKIAETEQEASALREYIAS